MRPTRLLYVLLMSFTVPAAGQNMPERWNELMKLVKTEIQMLEGARKRGDEVHYRLLELYSERMKLALEKENKAFLEAKDGSKHAHKDSYFSGSLHQYLETRSFGEKLLSQYPDSKRRGAMYYALALNSRDFGRDKRTEGYLLKALELIRQGSALRHNAETSLADFYYNEKRFPEAIRYYEKVVKNEEDEWLPKHLLNLGWCYLKSERHDEAITSLKKAYALGKEKRYVDIREQTLQNLAPFFVFGNRIDDGREFYVKNERDPMPYLLSLAKRAADKGHGKETEEILQTMQRLIGDRDLMQHQEDLVLYELDFFRTYKRWDDHLQVSGKLLALHQLDQKNPEKKWVKQKDDGIEKVRSVAGFLQLKTAQDVKKGGDEYSARDLKRTMAYFDLLRELDGGRKDEYAYFKGETYYAVNRYADAATAYKVAMEDSKITPVVERQRKILNSLLALTGEERLDKTKNRELLSYTYENHIAVFPVDPMSLQIYPKLFQLYREEKRDDAAVSALERYHKNYPQDLSKQQELMKGLVDDFIKAKNVLKITHWIGEFKRGFLKLDAKTIEQTEIILGQILFVTAQEHVRAGRRQEALAIFEDVYRTTLYPSKVRALAGIQAADLELELARPVAAIPWIEKSLELFTLKELDEKSSQVTAMLERMAYMREFRGAVRLTDLMLQKTCSLKTKAQDRLWELSVGFHLVLADDRLTQGRWAESSRCASNAEVAVKLAGQILWYYHDINDVSRLVSFWEENRGKLDRGDYVDYLLDLYWDRPGHDQRSLRSELLKLKDNARVAALIEDFHRQEAFQVRREALLKTVLVDNTKAFDPEAFNPVLEKFLLEIKKLGEEVKPLLASSHSKVREQTHQQLQGFYAQVADLIAGLKPLHDDQDFVVSFQTEMRKIAKVFETKVVDFKKTARHPSGDVTFLSPVQPPLSSVSMDRFPGGRQ